MELTMRTEGASAASAVLILVIISVTPATANSDAFQERSLEASTTLWSVSPSPRGGIPQNIPLLMNWTVVTNTAYSYFDAVNTGAGELSRLEFSATSAAAAQNPNNATVTFEICRDGVWNPSNNSCNGTVVPLGSYTGPNTLNIVINHTLAVGERLALRATTPQNRRNDLTTTISFSVSRAGARAATMTGT
jgi:hypothetical protein